MAGHFGLTPQMAGRLGLTPFIQPSGSVFFCPSVEHCPQTTSSGIEEVVMAAADIDKECLLSQSTTFDMEEDFGEDTIKAARTIRKYLGNHESEVSFGGEADLHQHYKRCKKNPGHSHFIPVEDFKKEHLPLDYRDNTIVDWIRAEADLTCRLAVKCTSESRPKFFPGSQDPFPFYQLRGRKWMRTGTGRVKSVQKYTDKDNENCGCKECIEPGTHTPKKFWGEVTIVTAHHVVFDCVEARHTTCYFFYDRSTSTVSDFPTLSGIIVKCSIIKGDACMMTCYTHDMDLVDKLLNMCDRRQELFEKVRRKYWLDQSKGWRGHSMSYVSDPTPGHVVIISHPHGCNKHISVGEWTDRQTQEETGLCEVNNCVKAEYVNSSYKYNAATCPGSSGAPVIRLLEKGRVGWWWLLYSHPHSGGDAGNNNYSCMMEEFVSCPLTSSDEISKQVFLHVVLFMVLLASLGLLFRTILIDVWDIDRLWVVLCTLILLVLCYWFFPWCRQERVVLCSVMIGIWLFSLVSLITFVEILVMDAHIVWKVFLGICSVDSLVLSVKYFRWFKASTFLTSYNLQCRLRSRTPPLQQPPLQQQPLQQRPLQQRPRQQLQNSDHLRWRYHHSD